MATAAAAIVAVAAVFPASRSPRLKPSLPATSAPSAARLAASSPQYLLPLPLRWRRPLALAAYAMDATAEETSDGADFSPELKLFVGNLPFSVDSSQLAGLFQRAGSVEMVEVIYDKVSGRSRGFGFVTMSTADEVEAAVQQFNGFSLEGRALRVTTGPPPSRSEAPTKGYSASGVAADSSNRVFVGNLSWGVDDATLEALFSEQGTVVEASVVYDRETGRSRGFGFVTYSNAEGVNNAISWLDGTDLDGRPIRVSVAESRVRRQY